MDWHWNTGMQFQVSKFITRLLRHSQKVHREDDGAVHYDQVVDECKKNNSTNTGYWSVEMKKDFVNAPHWSIEKWISVLAEGGGQKKRFQYCLNPNYLHPFLYPLSISRRFMKYKQSCMAWQCIVTRRFYRVCLARRNKKESRSIVNHGLNTGGDSLKTGRQAVFCTVVNPMDNQDGFGETLCDVSQARISRHTRILGNAFRIQYFGAIWSSLNKDDCNFIKQGQTQLVISTTHCLQSSLRKRYAWRPRIRFTKGKAWF